MPWSRRGVGVGKICCMGASLGPWTWDSSSIVTGGKAEDMYRCGGVGRFCAGKIRNFSFLSFVQATVAMLRDSFQHRYFGQLNIHFFIYSLRPPTV